jgi:outer membrane protein OmpA-like peptidoglycan-associated protein
MRRSAPSRAFVRCSLPLLLVLAAAWPTPAAAQTAAQEAAGSGSVQGGADAVVEAPSSAPGSQDDGARERREELLRRGPSYLGPVGGIHVIEAGSGAPRSFRLQVVTDFFYKRDYIYPDDQNRYIGGALSLGITPIEHLELTAGVTARSNRNSESVDEVLQTFGDPHFDIKSYGEVARGITVGGDVFVALLTKPDEDGVAFAGTSVGLRANLSLDLRRMPARVPLELRFNAGYLFDASRDIIEGVEKRRLQRLRDEGRTTDLTGRNEVAHLARREERIAYAVNRVDHASFALGLEAPLKLSKRVALHPIAEWEFWIPINRQDYDCPILRQPDGSRAPGQDGCLADEGASTWPQRFTAGARLYPALGGFSMLAALEIGIGGSRDFVRELAPSAPYKFYAALAYTVDYDPKPAPVTVVKQVEKRVEVPVAPKEGRIRGRVVEQGPGTPVPNARIAFPRRELSALLSGANGEFVSYEFPPGNVEMELEAEGYRPNGCNAQIPPNGGDVEATCELIALPRLGSVAVRVVDVNGAPVGGIPVLLTGPQARNPVTDSSGQFREADLPPGDYQARIEQPAYMVSLSWMHVDERKETAAEIRLTPKPAKPLVTVQKTRLALKGVILFNTNTADLDPRSEPLVAEIADVLIRTPQILRVEIRGHTDTVGTPDYNLDLSQRRADTIKERLQRLGVEGDRLFAKGFGATKPVAPNISEQSRAKNRRVEFAIVERAGQ